MLEYENYKYLVVDGIPQLPKAEERAYAKLAKSSADPEIRRKAREKLVRSTFRFILKEALKKSKHTGLPVEDLVVTAKTHVWKAVDKFEPNETDKDVRFLSFIVHDIKHAFQEVMRKSKFMKGADKSIFDNLVSIDAAVRTSEEGEESAQTLGDILEDKAGSDYAVSEENRKDATKRLSAVLDMLPSGDREILALYYGLGEAGGGGSLSLNDIATLRGISKQALHQQVGRAMRVAKKLATKYALE